jgi:hypothetical protein
MHPQKRDLVIATGEQLECECGRPVVPFSCYCAECEAEIEAREVAAFLTPTYAPGSGEYNDAMYGDY